jgi:hypothetical protein
MEIKREIVLQNKSTTFSMANLSYQVEVVDTSHTKRKKSKLGTSQIVPRVTIPLWRV